LSIDTLLVTMPKYAAAPASTMALIQPRYAKAQLCLHQIIKIRGDWFGSQEALTKSAIIGFPEFLAHSSLPSTGSRCPVPCRFSRDPDQGSASAEHHQHAFPMRSSSYC